MQRTDLLLVQVRGLATRATDANSLMAQTVELLRRERPHYQWVGVYLLQGETLVLGPYVGKPTPHTRIPLNQGICGAAATTRAGWTRSRIRSSGRQRRRLSPFLSPLRRKWTKCRLRESAPALFSSSFDLLIP